jgi:hypothetical protein
MSYAEYDSCPNREQPDRIEWVASTAETGNRLLRAVEYSGGWACEVGRVVKLGVGQYSWEALGHSGAERREDSAIKQVMMRVRE